MLDTQMPHDPEASGQSHRLPKALEDEVSSLLQQEKAEVAIKIEEELVEVEEEHRPECSARGATTLESR